MAYAFNDDKSKVETYVKDNIIIKRFFFSNVDPGEYPEFEAELGTTQYVVLAASQQYGSGESRGTFNFVHDNATGSMYPQVQIKDHWDSSLGNMVYTLEGKGYNGSGSRQSAMEFCVVLIDKDAIPWIR